MERECKSMFITYHQIYSDKNAESSMQTIETPKFTTRTVNTKSSSVGNEGKEEEINPNFVIKCQQYFFNFLLLLKMHNYRNEHKLN